MKNIHNRLHTLSGFIINVLTESGIQIHMDTEEKIYGVLCQFFKV